MVLEHIAEANARLGHWEPLWLFVVLHIEALVGLVGALFMAAEIWLLWRFATVRQKDSVKRTVRNFLKSLRGARV